MTQPRDRSTRVTDTLARLEGDVDLWCATADPDGGPPALVPLSFDWNGHDLLLATLSAGPAAANMRASGLARVALGEVRDVVMIDARAEEVVMGDVPDDRWQRYADRAGWDPRDCGPAYTGIVLTPRRIQAWREADEIAGRTLMADGRWLTIF